MRNSLEQTWRILIFSELKIVLNLKKLRFEAIQIQFFFSVRVAKERPVELDEKLSVEGELERLNGEEIARLPPLLDSFSNDKDRTAGFVPHPVE